METIEKMWKIPYLGDCLTVTSHTNGKGHGLYIMMAKITDEQELALDNKNHIIINRGPKKYDINQGKIIAYGDIDFKTDSDDMNTLKGLDLIEPNDLYRGEFIPTVLDYDNNEQTSKLCETFDFSKLCKYVYCKIGRPKKVLIFKQIQ